jgi:hypothetical protein
VTFSLEFALEPEKLLEVSLLEPMKVRILFIFIHFHLRLVLSAVVLVVTMFQHE